MAGGPDFHLHGRRAGERPSRDMRCAPSSVIAHAQAASRDALVCLSCLTSSGLALRMGTLHGSRYALRDFYHTAMCTLARSCVRLPLPRDDRPAYRVGVATLFLDRGCCGSAVGVLAVRCGTNSRHRGDHGQNIKFLPSPYEHQRVELMSGCHATTPTGDGCDGGRLPFLTTRSCDTNAIFLWSLRCSTPGRCW